MPGICVAFVAATAARRPKGLLLNANFRLTIATSATPQRSDVRSFAGSGARATSAIIFLTMA